MRWPNMPSNFTLCKIAIFKLQQLLLLQGKQQSCKLLAAAAAAAVPHFPKRFTIEFSFLPSSASSGIAVDNLTAEKSCC